MEFSIHFLCLLASLSLYCVLLSVQVSEGQFVPGRCECYNTNKRVTGQLSDLRVIPQSHTCTTDQIIVVMKTNKSVCVDPTGKLGKQLLRCWRNAKDKGVDVKRCLNRKKKDQSNQGQNPQKKTKPMRQPKLNRRRATPIPA
ncbi:eotaxin [Esox lucius]|uniref:eotaxin n=1 Tax=Esox lucius TaxID=8010 RepID=UPI000577528D|nr:eotaxin [Esox lucius]